jgi:predicted Fe-S protein YdhL (DUF1289 family)
VVLATSILLLACVSVSRNRRKQVGSVESPCVLVCRIKDGYCVGCQRTIDEIRDWIIMSEYEQNKLIHELKWRRDVRDANH